MKAIGGKMATRFSPIASSSAIRYRMPTLTHGIPGMLIGGIAVAALVGNHVFHRLWEALPILIGAAMIATGIVWFVSAMERGLDVQVKVSAFVIALIGTVWFGITWGGHTELRSSHRKPGAASMGGYLPAETGLHEPAVPATRIARMSQSYMSCVETATCSATASKPL